MAVIETIIKKVNGSDVTVYPTTVVDAITDSDGESLQTVLDGKMGLADGDANDLVTLNANGTVSGSGYYIGEPQQTTIETTPALMVLNEMYSGKQLIADAINAKGGSAGATESFAGLAQDIQDTPTSGVLSTGIVQSAPFSFLDYVCRADAHPFSEIDDDSVTVISRQKAFSNQTQLLKVRMSALGTISCNEVFINCSALQEVDMPNLTTISGEYTFQGCSALRKVDMLILTIISGRDTFVNCSALQEVDMANLTTISGGQIFSGCSTLRNVTLPNLTIINQNNTFRSCSLLQNVIFGKMTSLNDPFANAKPNLRNITIGQDTDVNLPFQQWTAANVIAEGQSGIDELNTNLYNNLLTKLYDHSQDGETRTLRIGWLAKVSAENIAYATAKGWTLTT